MRRAFSNGFRAPTSVPWCRLTGTAGLGPGGGLAARGVEHARGVLRRGDRHGPVRVVGDCPALGARPVARELLDVAAGPGRAALDVERQPRFRVGYLVSTGMRVVSEAEYLGRGSVCRPELHVCAGVERARRYIERGIAGQGAFNGEVAVEFGWFRVGFCLRIVSLEVELRQPPVARDICNVRYGRECDSAVGCAPFPLVHRVRHERVLYPRDARWEAAVVGIDGKTGLLCIQVLLDALGVGGSPLVGLAVLDEVIVFEAR